MLRLNLHCECSILDLIQPINELLDSYVIDFLVNVNGNLLRVYPTSDDDEQEEESHGREEGESDDEASFTRTFDDFFVDRFDEACVNDADVKIFSV